MPPCPVGNDVALAARLLRDGRLVAFATETVYGLGADAFNPAAVAQVFHVKRRPQFDPIIVHVPHVDWLPRVVSRVPALAHRLASTFWPGPLTIVLPKSDAVPDLVTAGLPFVGVRIPAHPMARELIERAGTPIAAPSANPFGQVSPTTAAHVVEQLGDQIDYVLDGGPCAVGVESTVLSLAGIDVGEPPTLLRPGGVPLEELEAVAGRAGIAIRPAIDDAAAPAPGMMSRHYAPRTHLRIVAEPALTAFLQASPHEDEPEGAAGGSAAACRDVASCPPRVGLLTFTPPRDARPFAAVEILSREGSLPEAASHFFAALRRLDALRLDLILATPFPEDGLGRALNDRLRRAATAPRVADRPDGW